MGLFDKIKLAKQEHKDFLERVRNNEQLLNEADSLYNLFCDSNSEVVTWLRGTSYKDIRYFDLIIACDGYALFGSSTSRYDKRVYFSQLGMQMLPYEDDVMKAALEALNSRLKDIPYLETKIKRYFNLTCQRIPDTYKPFAFSEIDISFNQLYKAIEEECEEGSRKAW